MKGFEYSATNWAEDYVFFLDHSPAEIYPNETIVGEFHWQLDEARKFVYPDEVTELGFDLRQMGAGGTSLAHTLSLIHICLFCLKGSIGGKILVRLVMGSGWHLSLIHIYTAKLLNVEIPMSTYLIADAIYPEEAKR